MFQFVESHTILVVFKSDYFTNLPMTMKEIETSEEFLEASLGFQLLNRFTCMIKTFILKSFNFCNLLLL